ncbi:MAG TPA: hypothetical protein VLC47_13750 [Burkholderiales bacterium]|nr:hypothetical protein [Burkholderiales bacterium]
MQRAIAATPAAPAKAPDAKQGKGQAAKKQDRHEPTKTQTRAGEPKGEAKGQTK